MNILFGRKKYEKVAHKEPEISQSFAQEVLDLEVEINFNCVLPTLQRLMELYTQAIEYYESDKNQKFVYYQEKMQKLLSRPDVLKVLTQNSKDPSKEDPIPNVVERPSPSSLKSPRAKAPSNKLPLERNCEKVLQNHNAETTSVSKKILDNIKSQSDSLSQRIESRKCARSFKTPKKIETDQYDKSGGEAKLAPVEEFELEIETIMETFVEEKSNARKEIEEKYQEYISEIEFMEGEVIKSLIKELNKNMEIEIEEAVKKAEDNRARAIALARKKLANKC